MQLLVLLLALGSLFQTTFVWAESPQHFVFFALERDRLRESSFLETEAFAGAQLKYTWRELEPEKDCYDLAPIREDLEFLQSRGKKLFIQVQDVSFSREIVNVPEYLRSDPRYGGGANLKYEFEDEEETKPIIDGWVARRWDPAVLDRFSRLMQALGKELDGRIEGVNLAETSAGFGNKAVYHPEGYTFESYRDGIKKMMKSARDAFPRSTVLVYANFMPGEWLPWEDKGYLKSIYEYAHDIGVGVGGPDLMPYRKGQLNHSYPLIHARDEHVAGGVAVQWGNYEHVVTETGERISIEEIYDFASGYLKLDYLFWCTQEPYYSQELIPYLRGGGGR
jgi:hypothetical protein